MSDGGVDLDDECIHGLTPRTCSTCKGKDTTAAPNPGGGGSPQSLDTPEALERYRQRYAGDREATFEAYVEVFFFGAGDARDFPGGWTKFSRCANAEPSLVKQEPEQVARAEAIMRRAGYVADDSGRPRRGRKWHSTH